LLTLVEILCDTFGEICPVYSKEAAPPHRPLKCRKPSYVPREAATPPSPLPARPRKLLSPRPRKPFYFPPEAARPPSLLSPRPRKLSYVPREPPQPTTYNPLAAASNYGSTNGMSSLQQHTQTRAAYVGEVLVLRLWCRLSAGRLRGTDLYRNVLLICTGMFKAFSRMV